MNGLAHITIAGQKVGLKFGLPAVRRFFEKTTLFELMADNMYTELGVAHILYAGYLNHCMMREEAPVLEFQPFYELIESLDSEDVAKEVGAATKVFEESKYIKRIVTAMEDEKKKVMKRMESQSTGMELNLSASESLDTPLRNTAV